MGCQKVSPDVYMLGSAPVPKIDVPANPAGGRVTLGSDEHILSEGTYKLKGRVGTAESVTNLSGAGTYKLRGTVHF